MLHVDSTLIAPTLLVSFGILRQSRRKHNSWLRSNNTTQLMVSRKLQLHQARPRAGLERNALEVRIACFIIHPVLQL